MEISIEIETQDKRLISDLFESRRISSGFKKEILEGASIRFESGRIREAVGFPDIIQITLIFGSGVAASYLANWLYAKLSGRVTKIRIDRLEIKFDKGEIEKILREKVELE